MKAILWTTLLFASFSSWAQDERYFRKIYSNELIEKSDKLNVKVPDKVIVQSPNYRIDINRDGFEEIIQTVKRDGRDYFVLRDQFGKTLIDEQLSAIGSGGVVYRVQFKTISADTDALVIHYYEGAINDINFVATARLYFLTISQQNLSKIYFHKGPHFFHEYEKQHNKYSVKRFSVNTLDYNKDGIKEISVTYNKISKIYFYVAQGIWQKY